MDFHNRKNIRQVNHDYSKSASYFITINIKLGQCLFGKAISPSEIQLTELGKTAQKFWIEIPEHFSHVRLDEFIIMPNHLHGIIHVNDMQEHNKLQPFPSFIDIDVGSRYIVIDELIFTDSTTENAIGSRNSATDEPTRVNQFGPLPKGSLAVIIGQYKSSVSRWANLNKYGGLFSWHSRFYDRIINDQKLLIAAQTYIRQNPEKWWKKYRDQEW